MEIIGEKKEEVQEPKVIPEDFNFHINISFFPKTGKVELRTNLNDIFLAMGLWDVTKDMLKSKIIEENKSKVVKPNGGIVNFVRGLKH
jgi:hypothetical protein